MSRRSRAEALGLTCEGLAPGTVDELVDQDLLATDEIATWNWRFRDNPFGAEVACARDGDGRIQALLASQLTPVWVGDRSAPAALVSVRRFAAGPSSRQRYSVAIALGEFLAERLRERGASVVFWEPDPPDDRPGQKYLRHDAVRLVNPIRIDSAHLCAALPVTPATPVALSELEGIDDLWQRAHAQLGVTTVRSAEYFGWRYDRHPDHEYVFFGERSGTELEAVAVVRAEQDASQASIVDWLVPVDSREAGLRLAAGIAGWADESGFPSIDAWFCESSPYFEAAQDVGFRLQPGGRLLVARPLLRTLGIEMLRVCWNLVYGDLSDQ